MKKVPTYQIALSVGALAAWLLLYAGGLLCETIEQRVALAPNALGKQLGATDPVYLKGVERASTENPAMSFFIALVSFTPRLPPSFLPRRFAAASASFVRFEIMPASNSATAAIC